MKKYKQLEKRRKVITTVSGTQNPVDLHTPPLQGTFIPHTCRNPVSLHTPTPAGDLHTPHPLQGAPVA